MEFPKDFKKRKHPHFKDAWQWYIYKDDNFISVVGGSERSYGDGVSTFEVLNDAEESPMYNLTIEEVNEYLKNLK